ncbi:MAG TPA: hypothetical protein VFM49_12730 [Chloroflexia bacterium]|jgi:hypothetical protein|nr:hypothetical protein [Chloroflexia bacterium]
MDDELNRAKDNAQATGEEMAQKTQHAGHEAANAAKQHDEGLVDNIMDLGSDAGHAVAEGAHDLARGIHDAVTGLFHHDKEAPHVEPAAPSTTQPAVPPAGQDEGDNVV